MGSARPVLRGVAMKQAFSIVFLDVQRTAVLEMRLHVEAEDDDQVARRIGYGGTEVVVSGPRAGALVAVGQDQAVIVIAEAVVMGLRKVMIAWHDRNLVRDDALCEALNVAEAAAIGHAATGPAHIRWWGSHDAMPHDRTCTHGFSDCLSCTIALADRLRKMLGSPGGTTPGTGSVLPTHLLVQTVRQHIRQST